MQIHGFSKLTLLDYPGHLAGVIFLGGCNMRCSFCQNASLVLNPSSLATITKEDVLTTLAKRAHILEGLCISGGEPTLYDELPTLIKEIKALGYKVKLDTNGTNPKMLLELIKEDLLDYIAMDIKNSKEKYAPTCGVMNISMDPIEESIDLIMASSISYEFRTTIIKEYHTIEDIHAIGNWIKGAKAYYLQSYEDSGDILCPGLSNHSKETLYEYIQELSPYLEKVALRGIN